MKSLKKDVYPMSHALEVLLGEVGDECAKILGYLALLKQTDRSSETFSDFVAYLYTSLTVVASKAQSVQEEIDCLEDLLPEGEE